MSQRIINGDSAEVLKTIESNSIDAVVTDPPYGIEFLGREWDSNTGAVEIWRECLRVLKPGGHLLAFSAARTYHHLATNIEGVGFDIRDQIMWIYASGFPKAQDIGKSIQRRQGVEKQVPSTSMRASAAYKCEDRYGKQNAKAVGFSGMDTIPTSPEAVKWSGWKTALKPAHEPIVMARKPMKGSTIDNVLEHGVGALNIDATRIDYKDLKDMQGAGLNWNKTGYETGGPRFVGSGDEHNAVDKPKEKKNNINEQGRFPSNVMGEVEGYQKYFYCPKVSRRERHRGFEQHTESAPQGERRCSTDSHERWHQGMEHKKGGKPDPLAHIKKGDNFGDGLATGIDIMTKARGNDMANKNNAAGKIETGLTDKNGNVQTFTSDPATHNLGNNHPTVKPVELMKYLVKLVTPAKAHILDPFAGSGSTGMACRELGRQFTGIDLDPNYCEIARRRIAATQEDKSETLFE